MLPCYCSVPSISVTYIPDLTTCCWFPVKFAWSCLPINSLIIELLFHVPLLVSAFICCPVAIVANFAEQKKLEVHNICLPVGYSCHGRWCCRQICVLSAECSQHRHIRNGTPVVTAQYWGGWWYFSRACIKLKQCTNNALPNGSFNMTLPWISTLYMYRMYCLQECVICGKFPLLYLCIAVIGLLWVQCCLLYIMHYDPLEICFHQTSFLLFYEASHWGKLGVGSGFLSDFLKAMFQKWMSKGQTANLASVLISSPCLMALLWRTTPMFNLFSSKTIWQAYWRSLDLVLAALSPTEMIIGESEIG